MPTFSQQSTNVLNTLHPALRLLMTEVVKHHDITLIEGHRGQARQTELYTDGKSQVQWPNSRHNSSPSMAVDVAPWPIPINWGNLGNLTGQTRDMAWKERVKFYEMLAVIRYEWARCQQNAMDLDDIGHLPDHVDLVSPHIYRLRTGNDWDSDGDYTDQTFDDLAHVEIWPIDQAGEQA